MSLVNFLTDHRVPFISGVTIGNALTKSLPGAMVCGGLNAVLSPNVDQKTQMFATLVFAGLKYFSPTLNENVFAVITPFIFDLFNRNFRVNTIFLSLFSIGYNVGIISSLRELVVEVITSHLGSAWSFHVNNLNALFQFRAWKGFVMLWYIGAVGLLSFECGRQLLRTHYSLKTNQFSKYHLKKSLIAIYGLFSVKTIFMAEVANGLMGRYFGDTKLIIASIAFLYAFAEKYRFLLVDQSRKESGRIYFSEEHWIEMNRKMKLISSKTRERDQEIELEVDQEIRDFLVEGAKTLVEKYKDPNQKITEKEMKDLKDIYIPLLKKQRDLTPNDEEVSELLSNSSKITLSYELGKRLTPEMGEVLII